MGYDSRLIGIDDIKVDDGRRPVDREAVRAIAASIKQIGLQNPISLMAPVKNVYRLITGRHRLEATRLLGDHMILASIMKVSDDDARLWEISENLHRADLSKLERAEQVVEWKTLTADRVRKVSAPLGGVQPKEFGNRKTAKELGIDEKEVRNATKIAAITPEAKEAARAARLDDNQSALLTVAEAPPEQQRAMVATIVARSIKSGGYLSNGSFTGNDEWFTPDEHIVLARTVLGTFDLDPASHAKAQHRIRAATFFTQEQDGLSREWRGRVWLNPPYSQPKIEQFVDKLICEVAARRVTDAIMLTNSATDTSWFQKAARSASSICFTRGRLRFVSPDGNARGMPAHGQTFFYFGPRAELFASVFSDVGLVFGAPFSASVPLANAA